MDSAHDEGNVSSASASAPGLEKDTGSYKDQGGPDSSNIFKGNPLGMVAPQYQPQTGESVYDDEPAEPEPQSSVSVFDDSPTEESDSVSVDPEEAITELSPEPESVEVEPQSQVVNSDSETLALPRVQYQPQTGESVYDDEPAEPEPQSSVSVFDDSPTEESDSVSVDPEEAITELSPEPESVEVEPQSQVVNSDSETLALPRVQYQPQTGESVYDDEPAEPEPQSSVSVFDDSPTEESDSVSVDAASAEDSPATPADLAAQEASRRESKRFLPSIKHRQPSRGQSDGQLTGTRVKVTSVIALLLGVAGGLLIWDASFNGAEVLKGITGNRDKVVAEELSSAPITVLSDDNVVTLCQQDSVDLDEVGVFWFGKSLEYNRTNSFWSDNPADASATMQQVVTELYETVGDGCTASGAAYWRNVLPHSIDADRPGVDNYNASVRRQAYLSEPATHVAVVEETARQLNACVNNASFVHLTSVEMPRIYVAAYTPDYGDVVFVETPLLKIDQLPDGSQGLKVIRCAFGKTEGTNGEYVNDVHISPSLRAIVFLDRPAGLPEGMIVLGDSQPESDQSSPDGEAVDQPDDSQATSQASSGAPYTSSSLDENQASTESQQPASDENQDSTEDQQPASGESQTSTEDTESSSDQNQAAAEGTLPEFDSQVSKEPRSDSSTAAADATAATNETQTAQADTSQSSSDQNQSTSTKVAPSNPPSEDSTTSDETQTASTTSTPSTEETTVPTEGETKPEPTPTASPSPVEDENCPSGNCDQSGTTPSDQAPAPGMPGEGNQGSDGKNCGNTCDQQGQNPGPGQTPGDGSDGKTGDTCTGDNCPGSGNQGCVGANCPGDGSGGNTCTTPNCPGDGNDGDDGNGSCPGDDCPGDDPPPVVTPTPPPSQCPPGWLIDPNGLCKEPDPGPIGF